MKTSKYVCGLVAAMGLSTAALQADQPDGVYNVLTFNLTATLQATNSPVETNKESTKGTTTTTTDSSKYITTKVKITNKELLKLLTNDNGGAFATGAKLVSDSSDAVLVADKTGTNILYTPSSFTCGQDSDSGDWVQSGTSTTVSVDKGDSTGSSTDSESLTGTGIGAVAYTASLDSTQFLRASGLASSTSTYSYSDVTSSTAETMKESLRESFTGTVAGTCSFNGASGFISGTVSGVKSYSTKTVTPVTDSASTGGVDSTTVWSSGTVVFTVSPVQAQAAEVGKAP